ncbi:MAG: glycosyltransferase family 4 protein [Nanoarchaeota archaeon]|nr:glycosyltransferase family 4 protein [Nanoarchaeota archaeon]
MKILEICPYSAGVCGVWTRVFSEARLLKKAGHEVYVFSSDIEKGSNKKVPDKDEWEGVKIRRFPVKLSVGENAHFWNFKKEFAELKPDIVIVHVYRHPHTNQGLDLAKKHGAKCYLVTHAPFVEKGLRSKKLELGVKLYDLMFKKNFSKYDKVIAITYWEKPYLLELRCPEEKIVYIPNGIPDEFFKEQVKKFRGKKVLFLGRIAPIKNLEVLIKAISEIKDINLDIVGPAEEDYLEELKELVKKLDAKNINFNDPVYDLKKKIKKIQEADVFVLPSKREAMPQALIETMALGKIVIASKTKGAVDIIKNGKNGFLFELDDYKDLKSKLEYVLDKNNIKIIEKIQKDTRKFAERFKWSILIKDLEKIIDG